MDFYHAPFSHRVVNCSIFIKRKTKIVGPTDKSDTVEQDYGCYEMAWDLYPTKSTNLLNAYRSSQKLH